MTNTTNLSRRRLLASMPARRRCYGAGRCNWAVQVAGGQRRSDLHIDCGAPGGNARRTSLCYRDDIKDAAADFLAMIADTLRDLRPI